MIRPCLRCHAPLTPDLAILDDARRAQMVLDFLPLRCAHGHTERVPLEPRSRAPGRYLPTCGYCGEIVTEHGPKGRQLVNHAACTRRESKTRTVPLLAHRYVAVDA